MVILAKIVKRFVIAQMEVVITSQVTALVIVDIQESTVKTQYALPGTMVVIAINATVMNMFAIPITDVSLLAKNLLKVFLMT